MKKIYTNCVILNGTEHMKPQSGLSVLVEDGKISAVAALDAIDSSGASIIDLGGRYLMPGLINLHVHLPAGGKVSKKKTDTKKLVKFILSTALTRRIGLAMCRGYAMQELLSGVTTIRTVGGVGNFDTLLRDRINAGKTAGPRILASNMGIGPEGGHMVGSVACAVNNADEGRAMVRKLAEQKVDLIKLMITGGVLDATVRGEPGILKMPPEIVKACCEQAHSLGFTVAAHVESPEGVRVALENGVDTIEHGAPLDGHMVELFRQHRASYICTISPALPLAKFDRSITGCSELVQYNSEVVFDGVISGTKTALENDIPVGLGTDTGCPFITHYNMWRELAYFAKYAGVSPEFALYSATLKNAQIAGVGEITGSIESGKCADFIVSDANPLKDFAALKQLYLVVKDGTEFSKPVVKKDAKCEQLLDSYMP